MAVGMINIVIYVCLSQLQEVGVYNTAIKQIPKEIIVIFLILLSIPVQFFILILIGIIFKENELATIITSGLFVVACTSIIWVTSSEDRQRYNDEQAYNNIEKYDYEQGISTPEGYPIKLLSESEFNIAIKGYNNPVTLLEANKVYSESWGNGDTTFKSSDSGGIMLLDSLRLCWYSFLEDKYYQLNTKLDKTKITNYFRKGYRWNKDGRLEKIENNTYKELVAGIAPGGHVVLWVSSRRDAKEVAIFKANEVSVEKIASYDIVDEEERKEVLSDTCTCENNIQFRKIVNNNKPIPFGIWTDKYRKKFNWKVSINNFGQTKSELDFYFFNGEKYALYNEEVTNMKYQPRVLPNYLYFTFIKDQKKYDVYLEFDENEIFNYFNKLTKNNSNEAIDIVVTIDSSLNPKTIQLHSKNKKLNFEKMKKVEIYKN